MPHDPAPPADTEGGEPEHPFAPYVRTLGRGPGRSRALTREEAREALGMVLRGAAEPEQIGAFLMLLRYRGEAVEEITGLVEAAREAVAAGPAPAGHPGVALDWPSYGAGRTRGAPWFLLAALALARGGHRVLMHGTNGFTSGIPVGEALERLGLAPARDRAEALAQVAESGFAYLPLRAMSTELDRLVGLRGLLGLRSPLNTVARLLNPADAPAGVDGVFHPPYIDLHLGVARQLGRPRVLVIKGGGGEAERNPAKALSASLHTSAGLETLTFAPLATGKANQLPIEDIWHGRQQDATIEATIVGTMALALIALGSDPADCEGRASRLWKRRHDTGGG